jgi:hypothetical protein
MPVTISATRTLGPATAEPVSANVAVPLMAHTALAVAPAVAGTQSGTNIVSDTLLIPFTV